MTRPIDPAHEQRPGTGICAACGLSLRAERGLTARCRKTHNHYQTAKGAPDG